MTKTDIIPTYEDKRDPQFINVAALEAERNLIEQLFKRDRKRAWREWGQTGLILVLGLLVWDQATSKQVVAYRIEEGLDGVERADFIEPFTVETTTVAQESRQWLEYVRMVSVDKVVEDKLRKAAEKRMDNETLRGQLRTYLRNQVDMPKNGTRDVLEDTFSFTQQSSGQNGLYTFVWKWYEQEAFNLVPSGGLEMIATVTMKARPPTRKEIRNDQLDGLFVTYFDIRPARMLELSELERIVVRR